MSRFVAFGDAHLGRSHLAHLRDGEGRPLREEDFLRSFAWAVEETVRQEPDGVLLLGDLFDHARPTYRVFSRVLAGLKSFRDAGLPVVAISGNHDTPRIRGTGSPYAALEEVFENATFAWNLEAKTADIADARIHAVPQTLTTEALREELERTTEQVLPGRTNVLIAHVALTALPLGAYRDINELELEEAAFDTRFDVVVLGHYHVHQRVSKRTWYAGATDAFGFGDVPSGAGPKGLVVLDTETGDVEHIANPHERALVTVSVPAAGLGPDELVDAVARAARGVPAGAVLRAYLNEPDRSAVRLVPRERFRDAVPEAVEVQVEVDAGPESLPVQGAEEIDALEVEWDRYVERQDLTGLERERIAARGREFLGKARGETA